MKKKYTVQQVASIAHITPRTLRYYDSFGLLVPSTIGENGYRYYTFEDLLHLQHILFFKELRFPLRKIKEIMQNPDFDILQVLQSHKQILEHDKERIEKIIAAMQEAIQMKGGESSMSTDDMFAGFNKKELEEYKIESEKRWGHTDSYKQSQERVKNFSKEDWEKMNTERDEILTSLCKEMHAGYDDPEVQKLIDAYFQYMQHFYDCNYEIFKGLGEMYVQDERFAKNFRIYDEHLPEFLRNAITYYCNSRQK